MFSAIALLVLAASRHSTRDWTGQLVRVSIAFVFLMVPLQFRLWWFVSVLGCNTL